MKWLLDCYERRLFARLDVAPEWYPPNPLRRSWRWRALMVVRALLGYELKGWK